MVCLLNLIAKVGMKHLCYEKAILIINVTHFERKFGTLVLLKTKCSKINGRLSPRGEEYVDTDLEVKFSTTWIFMFKT